MSSIIHPAVTALLGQYEQYKTILEEKNNLSREVARAKLRGNADAALIERYAYIDAQLADLSDAMTFASPAIWLQYKMEAYKHEAQAITTMHDLRLHCSKPGYICTKRYHFLNSTLKEMGRPTLDDETVYPDSLALAQILTSRDFLEIEHSADAINQWGEYEYNKTDEKVAKWENYRLLKP